MIADLIHRSLAIIEADQASSGAYIASPNFPTYHYCWFRDGAFIAYAMDQWEKHESARRFYDWASANVVARTAVVEHALTTVAQGLPIGLTDLLDTRYTLDGEEGTEDWPNFQLDGFGTLLWGMERHLVLSGQRELPASWREAVNLLIRYLGALWHYPNFDCWEEFPNVVAVSTLAALYGGLHAACTLNGPGEAELIIARATVERIKDFVLEHGVHDGHLIKQIRGEDVVDSSLLWATMPFGEHGLLQPAEPLMRATAARIERDLLGQGGGVHRYLKDSYYGGGEWILLTALLGEYRASIGDRAGAIRCLTWIEAQANEAGELPEQCLEAALYPERIAEWIERWGAVARPLLWSHANYLSLSARLKN